jgi:hypothetical protein
MSSKTVIMLAGVAALGSVLVVTCASAESSHRHHYRHLWNYVGPSASGANPFRASAGDQCRIVGSISGRCYNFYSDATFPQGIPGNNSSNGP